MQDGGDRGTIGGELLQSSLQSFDRMLSQHPPTTAASDVQGTPQPAPIRLPVMPVAVDYDLVIVGGGLVGLTLACAFQGAGLRVALIEAKAASAAVARGQAYHINLMSSRIFAGLGVWEAMRPGVNPIDEIHLSDATADQPVRFMPQDLRTPELGYVAEHRVLLEALQAQVSQCANVTYLCPVEVVQTQFAEDGVTLLLRQDGQEWQVRSRLVVAADGARSPIRHQQGIRTYGWQYWQACVVAFVQPEKPHQNVAYERFQPDGPFAILPLPGNLCRIVWTAPKAEAEAILALDDAAFLAKLKQRFGEHMGDLSLVGPRYLFPVQLMQSACYTRSRLALIGDAAHCCHPVGGQGVNLGIRDTAALAQVLLQAHQQGLDIGSEAVLRRYARWRSPENLVILAFTDTLNRLFSNTIRPVMLLRHQGLWALRHLPLVKVLALRLMTGLLGRSPDLAKR